MSEKERRYMEENLAQSVLAWYDAGHRDLPWRRTRDAYRVWVSEIMLQQTRAETVVPYYERFLKRYPTVKALAAADEEGLLKAWEGLGYYSRARNLQAAAKRIVSDWGGELPRTVQALRALPGIGAYTAGAIASIAYGVPAAAVDGNVERVLCRCDAVTDDMGAPAARRALEARAQALVPADRPGDFTNAMMELGATVCTPKNPACLLCPLRERCRGFERGIAQELPVKRKKKAQRVERRAVLLVFCEGRALVVQRQERLLGGLWVFPDALHEGETGDPAALCAALAAMGVDAAYDGLLGRARHVFTHIIWEMDVHAFLTDEAAPIGGGRWATARELSALPMPTAVRRARALAMERLTPAGFSTF